MTNAKASILSDSPIAAFPLEVYSHGLHSITWALFFQDPEGRIWHTGAIGNGIAVDTDRNPSVGKGIAVIGWNANVNDDNELRLYYTNTTGHIFERCYTRSRGWYDGALTGQFQAATYSAIAANHQGSQRTRVYYQDPNTDEIAQLFRTNPTGGFQQFQSAQPEGLKGTSIATDTGGSVELLYQDVEGEWVHHGGGPAKFTSQFEYAPGAAIGYAGSSVSSTGARVFTVTKDNKLAVTVFDRELNAWRESVELVDVLPGAKLTALDHSKPTVPNPPPHGTTAFTMRKEGEIVNVGFTDENTWDLTVQYTST